MVTRNELPCHAGKHKAMGEKSGGTVKATLAHTFGPGSWARAVIAESCLHVRPSPSLVLRSKPHHFLQEGLEGGGLSRDDRLPGRWAEDMLMVREGIRHMVRGIVISKERGSCPILAVVPILALEEAWLGMDEFHEKQLYSPRHGNRPFHEADRGDLSVPW